ncbi:MAG TPA: PAS domain-containing sensor histidine kinase [Xanthobacteraceae bacterium]|nr:PAS domain-containing sensor histidine kinase [Xanthobacteraceae bacterium]
MSVLAPVRDYIDALVHPSARHDAMTAARHRAFIGSRIVIGLTALAAFPAYLVFNGVPGNLEALFFGWMLLPILNAYFLSHTGRYEAAHVLAALALTILVTVIAASTGGIGSFAAVWLVVVPLEAALSASRRTVALSGLFALGGAALLVLNGEGEAAATGPDRITLAALGIVSAALYGTLLALRAGSLARTGSRLLSAGEARYYLLARNMSDLITRHGRNGAVLFASPAAESLFGMPPRELLGHGLFDRVHVADRPAYLTTLADAAACRQARSVEFRVRRERAGITARHEPHFIWVEMRCRPLASATGTEDGEVVAVVRDITERKAQEQAIEEARHEAERANAAKSRFLATMTHELRTPLNAIIGFSDMLMSEDTMKLDAARRHDYAHLINESGQHLLSVVNGILDMSKIESGNFELTPEPFAPAPILRTCCDLLALKAREAGIDLIVRVAGELPEITADKRAVKQILLNLLSNAIKFTDRGGRVTVSVKLEGANVVLVVEDTGVGIDATDLARIGDPFFQARGSYARPYDGTGLGLSIVKGLVALHAGTVEIRSRVGEGTCITVRLPIDCERSGIRDVKAEAQPRGEIAMHQPHSQVRKRA